METAQRENPTCRKYLYRRRNAPAPKPAKYDRHLPKTVTWGCVTGRLGTRCRLAYHQVVIAAVRCFGLEAAWLFFATPGISFRLFCYLVGVGLPRWSRQLKWLARASAFCSATSAPVRLCRVHLARLSIWPLHNRLSLYPTSPLAF